MAADIMVATMAAAGTVAVIVAADFGFGWGWGYPYAYYPPSYYYPPAYYAPRCGWVRMRVWRHHRRYWRRAWRCW